MSTKVIADRTDIVAIADAVRSKAGTTNEMTLGEIAVAVNGISTGVELPVLSSPASVGEVFQNKEYFDSNGEKQTGTFTIDDELAVQEELISQLSEILDSKASGGSGDGGASVETCTVTLITDLISKAGQSKLMDIIYTTINSDGNLWCTNVSNTRNGNELTLSNVVSDGLFILMGGESFSYPNISVDSEDAYCDLLINNAAAYSDGSSSYVSVFSLENCSNRHITIEM